MKMIKNLVLVTTVATIAVGAVAGPRGTDILHYSARTSFTNTGVEPSAAGSVKLQQNSQGKANHQRLEIALKDLGTNASYSLAAAVGSDPTLNEVADFTTDSKGRANLRYHGIGIDHGKSKGKGKGKALGRGKSALPAPLSPTSGITSLAIVDSAANTVLTADLTAPEHFDYLIKRNLSTNGVNAHLHIKANNHKSQFRLMASGLEATNNYSLVFNGTIVQTASSDAKGKLVINEPLQNATDILNLDTIELWDSVNTPVVSTTIP